MHVPLSCSSTRLFLTCTGLEYRLLRRLQGVEAADNERVKEPRRQVDKRCHVARHKEVVSQGLRDADVRKRRREGRREGGREGGRGGTFVACLRHSMIDHAYLSRGGTIPTPRRDISNIWALISFLPYCFKRVLLDLSPSCGRG